MKKLLLLAVLGLMSCGVDGPPIRPGDTEPGLSISGRAAIGVTKSR